METDAELVDIFDRASWQTQEEGIREVLRMSLSSDFQDHAGGSFDNKKSIPRVQKFTLLDDGFMLVEFKKSLFGFGQQVKPFKMHRANVGAKILTMRAIASRR